MRFEIAIQAHNFDKRLCWMLSSIIDQDNAHDIGVCIACLKGSSTEAIPRYFRFNRLRVRAITYDSLAKLQPRGHVRTDQLKTCEADWIVFADSDMLYPHDFFTEADKLVSGPFKDNTKCLYSSRSSTRLEDTNRVVDNLEYPRYVFGAYAMAESLFDHRCRNVGAGYFQMISMKAMKDVHGLYYQHPKVSKDGQWVDGPNHVRSDRKFRCRVGSEPIPLPTQFHLQHDRNYASGQSR